jgi:hypothetical protein
LSRGTIHTFIGLCLFVTGLVALYAVLSPRPDDPVPQGSAELMSLPTPDPLGRVEGVGPAVEQVLTDSGQTEVLGADEMSQIPPNVARALIEHRAVLILPPRSRR